MLMVFLNMWKKKGGNKEDTGNPPERDNNIAIRSRGQTQIRSTSAHNND